MSLSPAEIAQRLVKNQPDEVLFALLQLLDDEILHPSRAHKLFDKKLEIVQNLKRLQYCEFQQVYMKDDIEKYQIEVDGEDCGTLDKLDGAKLDALAELEPYNDILAPEDEGTDNAHISGSRIQFKGKDLVADLTATLNTASYRLFNAEVEVFLENLVLENAYYVDFSPVNSQHVGKIIVPVGHRDKDLSFKLYRLDDEDNWNNYDDENDYEFVSCYNSPAILFVNDKFGKVDSGSYDYCLIFGVHLKAQMDLEALRASAALAVVSSVKDIIQTRYDELRHSKDPKIGIVLNYKYDNDATLQDLDDEDYHLYNSFAEAGHKCFLDNMLMEEALMYPTSQSRVDASVIGIAYFFDDDCISPGDYKKEYCFSHSGYYYHYSVLMVHCFAAMPEQHLSLLTVGAAFADLRVVTGEDTRSDMEPAKKRRRLCTTFCK